MRHMERLRDTPWEPTFQWLDTALDAADRINVHHEDYPRYTRNTLTALLAAPGYFDVGSKVYEIRSNRLTRIHRLIFSDWDDAGVLRNHQTRVGPHRPPRSTDVEPLLLELEASPQLGR